MSGSASSAAPAPPAQRHGAGAVFAVFLGLGLTSFGGPIAHLGYFHRAFVQRLGWLDDGHFARLLALCQFLPGPASSQLGVAIGLQRAGWLGALAAFAGFTLPSALLMTALAFVSPRLLMTASGAAVVHGLKLVAVAVVTHGVWTMARRVTPDAPRVAIALLAAVLLLASGNAWLQLLAIAGGALLGLVACRGVALDATSPTRLPVARGVAIACALLFAVGLALGVLTSPAQPTSGGVAAAFYRAGALVFGGGHVVLPLLQQSIVETGWLPADRFLSGYGAAQAMPGPMFSLAAYLGAAIAPGGNAVAGAVLALVAVFVPGFLLLVAALPAWAAITRRPWTARAVAGVNAAVVGLLAAALVDPVCTQGLRGAVDVAIAPVGIALAFRAQRHAALLVVAWCVGASLVVALVPVWAGS